MRAALVLPTPRAPVNRKAWWTRWRLMALVSVRAMCSCPTRSPKCWGRYLRARTRYDTARIYAEPRGASSTPRGRWRRRAVTRPALDRKRDPCLTRRGAYGRNMRLEKFTVKAQEALAAARDLASERNHQEVTPEHVLHGAAHPGTGRGQRPCCRSWASIRRRSPVRSKPYCRSSRRSGARRPRSTWAAGSRTSSRRRPASPRSSRTNTSRASTCCWPWRRRISGAASRVLADAGVTRDSLLKALAEVRGSQRVTDPEAEQRYQSLERNTPAT